MKSFLPKIAFFLLFLTLFPTESTAQYRTERPDSAAFRATDLIAPGALLLTGLGIHYFAHDTWDRSVKNAAQEWHEYDNKQRGRDIAPFDDYIQYLPLVMDLGLGFTGVKTKHCFIDRTIEGALAFASSGIINGISKKAFHTLRPNDANYESFPSGHSCFVFTGAELVRLEYGWGWGAAAYGIAITVATMRVYRNWHWLSDVIMGAGVGILSANIGHWLLNPTKKLFGINLPENLQFGMAPSYDPVSGSIGAQLALRF